MHKIAILPTLMTLGNAVCGFASVAYASRIRLDGTVPDSDNNFYFLLSACLILGAMVFDALDGYVARLSKSSSEFGGQLDSLCDAISFGLAPAFLLLRMGQDWQGRSLPAGHRGGGGPLPGLRAVTAGTLQSDHHLGRRQPQAVPGVALSRGGRLPGDPGDPARRAVLQLGWSERAGAAELRHGLGPVGALIVSLLMVSNFPYPHFTHQLTRRRRRFDAVVQAVLIVCVLALIREMALFILFWVYALHAPVYYLLTRQLRKALSAHRTPVD